MKLLTRYVIREHIGPLVFALSALTSLLMLQYVTRQLTNLAGKGLPWPVIGEFFVLSLPFTVAMTMPMAVLVATLHAFGRLTAEREITALKASGVRMWSLIMPVLLCSLALSVFMVWFNDQVLAASNHRLRVLQQDIARTKPTLALQDQVLNAITDQFFLRVARTDASTNRMYDVVIYDLSGGPERKTIYADSGVITPASNNRDLEVTLFNGFSQEFVRADPRRLERSFFDTQIIRQAGLAQGFEASTEDDYKGEREMTVCELHRRYIAESMEVERTRQEYISNAEQYRKAGGPLTKEPRARPRADVLGQLYCDRFIPLLRRVFLPTPAKAQELQPPIRKDSLLPQTADSQTHSAVTDSAARALPVTADSAQQPAPGLTAQQDSILRAAGIDPSAPVVNPAQNLDPLQVARGALGASGQQLKLARENLDGFGVEIHKKFALSFACFVFVLLGPPIALRFPLGGAGVTIGVSIGVFGLYYICLMGGETLADKGQLPPFVAMWIANIVFALVALILLWRMETATDATRGGGLKEWWRDRKARNAILRELTKQQSDKREAHA